MDNADVVVFLCSNMIDQEVIGFSGEKFDYREYLTSFFFSKWWWIDSIIRVFSKDLTFNGKTYALNWFPAFD